MMAERVQAIAARTKSLGTIPLEFIRSEHERPGTTTFHGSVLEIPVVDFADLDRDRVVRAVVKSSQEWGIFHLVNHGIPVEVMKELQRVGKEFFELPQEEKEAYAMKLETETLEGYGTKLPELEGKKAWMDFFRHNLWPQSRVNHNIWPKKPPSYRFDFSWTL
ncbi:putative Flavonol synthase/flavanone 3-hydroxylase [Cocos nucifera]|uniref:Putative Flavonol synthase/flavanone 3-hydroxylase n=1 Tax=Cocos nucifera TaxID=13894 RepID=A0A8K0NB68_COCNU|nr:putative Flavonol synthase/flavanone 3-hydroxylase [Cocos nucifera]